MERTEDFKPGDRNSGNGNSPDQVEGKATTMREDPAASLTSVRPMKDGEPFVYGDSREDDPSNQGGFVSIDDSPMMNTTREDLPGMRHADAATLRETSHGQNDEIRPQYDKRTDAEGQVVVPKEAK